MVNGINSQINQVNLFNATNAFKNSNIKPEKKEIEHIEEDINLNDNNPLLEKIDMEDVKKFASMIGEDNLSQDDIKYGFTSGRSVIADWVI